MAIQNLTYAELGEIWGVSKDAARKKVEGLRLPRTRGNDGRARVQIDLEEVTHTPLRPKAETSDEDRGEGASGDREETAGSPSPEIRALQARVEDLASDLERERAETKRERDERLEERSRADRLAGDLAKLAGRLADAERANGAAEKDVALARAEAARALEEREADRKRHVEELERVRSAGVEEADRLRSALEEMRGRPWWRRLVG